MLIAIEGIDGSGKGTQAKELLNRLRKLGYTCELLSFPRYEATHSSKMVAQYLNGEFGDLSQVPPAFAATLFALDRMESQAHLEEMIQRNDLVIVDRYVSSNLAYQSARVSQSEQSMFIDWLYDLEFEVYVLPKPDVTILLDIPVTTSHELVARKDARTYTEQVYDLHERDSEYLSRVREAYITLINTRRMDHCQVIECLDSQGHLRQIDDLSYEICDRVIQCIQLSHSRNQDDAQETEC